MLGNGDFGRVFEPLFQCGHQLVNGLRVKTQLVAEKGTQLLFATRFTVQQGLDRPRQPAQLDGHCLHQSVG